MAPDQMFAAILVLALLASIAAQSILKRLRVPTGGTLDKSPVDERAETVKSEFSIPADSKRLDSDYAATKALVGVVLGEPPNAPKGKGEN